MFRFLMVGLVVAATSTTLAADKGLKVGFGTTDITPKVEPGKAVWIAGYGLNRPAIGVHDKLYARAIVLSDGSKKVALAVVDLVGLQYPAVLRIREKLSGFDYVMVASTHVHEGPDVIGMWGEKPLQSGVDPKYIDLVVERVVEAIQAADAAKTPAKATYGTAVDEEILRDSRQPIVKDGVIRVVHFTKPDGKSLGILLQQNCHPESLSSQNQYITADFLYFTVKRLEEKYGCPVAAFSGAVGGLMALPSTIKDDNGKELRDGNFEYAEVYGEKLARRAIEAIESAEPTQMTPIQASVQPVFIPLHNQLYKLGFRMKALVRDAYVWQDDPWAKSLEPFDVKKHMSKPAALKSEVGYVRMGDVHLAAIPGEAYPESVYGKFQEPVEPNVDFPDAPLEKPVVETLPGEKFLFIGLANDEVGYIVPKRQWDNEPPFAYGRKQRQYGEENSCGHEVAPILFGALEKAVANVKKAPARD